VTDVGQTRTPSRPAKGREQSGNPVSRWFSRLTLFVSQILDELRKVVRPTRAELWQYTIVVIVFVTAMMAFVAAIDFGFSKLIALVLGSGS
jgi:preprotein translocase subunit SecE